VKKLICVVLIVLVLFSCVSVSSSQTISKRVRLIKTNGLTEDFMAVISVLTENPWNVTIVVKGRGRGTIQIGVALKAKPVLVLIDKNKTFFKVEQYNFTWIGNYNDTLKRYNELVAGGYNVTSNITRIHKDPLTEEVFPSWMEVYGFNETIWLVTFNITLSTHKVTITSREVENTETQTETPVEEVEEAPALTWRYWLVAAACILIIIVIFCKKKLEVKGWKTWK